MGKGSSRRRRAEKATGHWSFDPLFVRLDDKDHEISARQVRAAVDEGELSPDVLVGIVTLPNRRIRAGCVADMVRDGIGRVELISRTVAKPGSRTWLPPPSPPSPSSNVQTPRSETPAPLRAPQSRQAPQSVPPSTTKRHVRPEPKWKAALVPTLIFGVPLLYCILGIGFAFFVSGDPEYTIKGIGIGLVWALVKSVGVLVGVFLWAGMMFGSSRSKTAMNIGMGAFALATLFGATVAYKEGFSHLQNNQFASITTLVERCMDAGIVRGDYRIGATCRDGWNSGATGRGACSHHGGVLYWEYPETQTRSVAQCEAMAKRIRWD